MRFGLSEFGLIEIVGLKGSLKATTIGCHSDNLLSIEIAAGAIVVVSGEKNHSNLCSFLVSCYSNQMRVP